MVPYKSTANEVSFEWSHHRISFTDSKVRTASHVFIFDSGSGLEELCRVDFDILGTKLTQIKIKYLCHTRNSFRTLRGRYQVNFQREDEP